MLQTFSFTGEDSPKKPIKEAQPDAQQKYRKLNVTGTFRQPGPISPIIESEEHRPLESYLKAVEFIKSKIREIDVLENAVRDTLSQMITLRLQLEDMDVPIPLIQFSEEEDTFEDIGTVVINSFKLQRRDKDKLNVNFRHYNDPFEGDISPVMGSVKKPAFSLIGQDFDACMDAKPQPKGKQGQEHQLKQSASINFEERIIEGEKIFTKLDGKQMDFSLKISLLDKELADSKVQSKKQLAEIKMLHDENERLKAEIQSLQMRLRDNISHQIVVQGPLSTSRLTPSERPSNVSSVSVIQSLGQQGTISNLPSQSEQMVSKSELDKMNSQLDRLIKQNARLTVELDKKKDIQTSAMLDRIDGGDDVTKLKKQFVVLQQDNQKLKRQLAASTKQVEILRGKLLDAKDASEKLRKQLLQLREQLLRNALKPVRREDMEVSCSILDPPQIVIHSPLTPHKARINEVMQAARMQLAENQPQQHSHSLHDQDSELQSKHQIPIQQMDSFQAQRKFEELIEQKIKKQKQIHTIERIMGSLTERLPASPEDYEDQKCASVKDLKDQPLKWITPLETMLKNNEQGISALSHISSEYARRAKDYERKARQERENYRGVISVLERKVARFKESQSTYNLLRQQVRILCEDKARLEQQLVQLNENVQTFNKETPHNQQRLQNVQQMKEQAQQQLQNITQRMEATSLKATYQINLKELESDRFEADTQIKQLKARLATAVSDIEELRKERDQIERETEEVTHQVNKLTQTQETVKKLKIQIQVLKRTEEERILITVEKRLAERKEAEQKTSEQKTIPQKEQKRRVEKKQSMEETTPKPSEPTTPKPQQPSLQPTVLPLIPLNNMKVDESAELPFVPASPIMPGSQQPVTPSAQQDEQSKDMMMLKEALKQNKPQNPLVADTSVKSIAESGLQLQVEKSQEEKKQMLATIEEQKQGMHNLSEELFKSAERNKELDQKIKELEARVIAAIPASNLQQIIVQLKLKIKELQRELQDKNKRIDDLETQIKLLKNQADPKGEELKLKPEDLQLKMLKEDIAYYKKCIDTHITEKARQDCELKQLTGQFEELQAAYKQRILREQAWIQKILNNQEFKPIDPNLNKDFLLYVYTMQDKVRKQEQEIKDTIIEIELDKVQQTEQIDKLRKTVTDNLKALTGVDSDPAVVAPTSASPEEGLSK